MADASEVAELWAGGVLPPENEYTVVQQKTVPYQELLMGSDAFKPFKRVLGLKTILCTSLVELGLHNALH